MDPDQALQNIRNALAALRADANDYAAAEQLADSTEALDEWLTRGGHLPAAWARGGDQSQP